MATYDYSECEKLLFQEFGEQALADFKSRSHAHRCERCDVTWRHPDSTAELHDRAEFVRAHSCPKCGTEIWDKFQPWWHEPSIGFFFRFNHCAQRVGP